MLKTLLVISLVSLGFFIPTTQVFAQTLDYQIDPQGPINPGQSYSIKVKVSCQNCPVKLFFQDDPQPMDLIQPAENFTDSNGVAFFNVTSFVSINRVVLLETQETSQPILLMYNDNKLLSMLSLINRVLSLGLMFPPMGNIYPYIANEQAGESTKTILIKTNKPFGTKLFKVYQYDGQGNGRFIKSTSEQEISVEVAATDSAKIGILACSRDTEDNISCVGPTGARPLTDQEELVQKEEAEINKSPFTKLFQSFYK